jgi:hypothetical protein
MKNPQIRKSYHFTQVALFCYFMLSFILDNWRPWTWSQNARIILIIWILIFFTLAEFIDNFRNVED